MNQNQDISLIYNLILLGFLCSSLYLHFRNKPFTALKYAAYWLMALLFLVLLYSYRLDIKNRIYGELYPSSAVEGNDGSISFRTSQDGHFYIDTKVNGHDVTFMVDTGASDVVIDKRLAKELGIDLNNLQYVNTYNTANGQVHGAPIRLRNIKIDHYTIQDVRASVNEADMASPLLGMSFLEKLDGYEVKNGTLKIWP